MNGKDNNGTHGTETQVKLTKGMVLRDAAEKREIVIKRGGRNCIILETNLETGAKSRMTANADDILAEYAVVA